MHACFIIIIYLLIVHLVDLPADGGLPAASGAVGVGVQPARDQHLALVHAVLQHLTLEVGVLGREMAGFLAEGANFGFQFADSGRDEIVKYFRGIIFQRTLFR